MGSRLPASRRFRLGTSRSEIVVVDDLKSERPAPDLPSHEPGVPIRGLRSRASPRRGAARTTVADFQVSLLSHVFLPVRRCGASAPLLRCRGCWESCEKEIQSFTVMVPVMPVPSGRPCTLQK